MEGAGNRHLRADAVPFFQEGIGLVLSRWSALQLAVENEWGGRDSRRKSELLCSEIFTWFTQTKEPLYIDDLESILDEAMLSLNTVADDGSVEEVAEKLIIMHEDCLDGDFRSIESLRQSHPPRVAHSHISQAVNDDEDEDEDDDEEEDGDRNEKVVMGNDGSSDMMVDASEYQSNSSSQPVPVNQPKVMAEAEDGWVQVISRRSRGKRN